MRNLRILMAAGMLCFSITSSAISFGSGKVENKTEFGIAIVNVNEVFSNSSFVKKANTELQNDFQIMQKNISDARNKLQTLSKDYNNAKNDKKIPDAKKATMLKNLELQQEKLNDLAKVSQTKIQDQQNAGMNKFNDLLKVAITSIAKQKNIHTVLNSASVLYTDDTWLDITKDVEQAMP
jgi:Skp family chaperone for outer membrane proteins